MKLCPQCDFIYEDNQRICEMDGCELVPEPPPVPTEQSDVAPTEVLQPTRLRSIGLAIAAIAGVVIASIISAVYFAQSFRSSEVGSDQASTQSSEHSTAPNQQSEVSLQNLKESPEGLPEQPIESSPSSVESISDSQSTGLRQSHSTGMGIVRTRLGPNPVAAGGPNGRSPNAVIVRLTNGASIKADEAWEKKEGVWYRQAGMVTFLKRSQVRTVERAANTQLKSSKPENSRSSENAIAQNRLSIRRLEPANPKKQSPVKSFLKKTGRILKKPFGL